MIRRYIVILLIGLQTQLGLGQNTNSSPYSMYGIGEIEANKSGQSIAMGGAGIAMAQASTLNSLNPAAYHSIDSLAFIFNFGIQSKQSIYTNHGLVQSNNDFIFNSLAVGFRIAKWWSNSLGITPFSSVGYKINTQKSMQGTSENFDVQVDGSGGVNKFYWGNSFKLTNNLYAGFNLSYLFGQITQNEAVTSQYFTGSVSTEDVIDVRNWCMDFGVQYTVLKKDNLVGTLGGTFSNKTKLNLTHDINILDNSSDTLASNGGSNSHYTLPTMFGIGAAVEIKNKLTLTADYKRELWQNTDNSNIYTHYVNAQEIRVGAEFQPKNTLTSSYIQRIQYRAGVFQRSSYLKIKGSQLQNYGFTLGLGLPIARTQLNIAYVYGSNGALNNSGVINQRYHLFALTLTLRDLWFVKFKYD
jgi:hypothetical protein